MKCIGLEIGSTVKTIQSFQKLNRTFRVILIFKGNNFTMLRVVLDKIILEFYKSKALASTDRTCLDLFERTEELISLASVTWSEIQSEREDILIKILSSITN